jgi:ribosomal RNA-processing protein 1
MCTSLASLISTIHAPNRAEFVRGFWMTMKREWTNIDVLRMEKFLLLTRRVVAVQFAICADAEWAQEVVEEQLGLLVETPLDCEDVRVPMGLRYHVIDVYVDELERAGALGEERRGVELEVLLGPLRELKGRSPTRSVREKAAEALGDERLPGNEKEDVEMEDEGWGGIED